MPGPYNAQRREHAAGARNRWKEEQKAKKMALQEQKAVRKNARSQAQQVEGFNRGLGLGVDSW